MTAEELDELAWKAVCEKHCHRITCDGPIDEASCCKRAHDIVLAVLEMSEARRQIPGMGE